MLHTMATSPHVASYIVWLKASGASPDTIRLRRFYIRRLAERHPGVSLLDLTVSDLADFLACDSWCPETRRSVRCTLRSFYRWALDAELISRSPAHKLPPIRIPAAMPRPTNEQVVVEALATADPRMRRMIVLAAYAGLRRSEIARLHTDDLTDGHLTIKGKGGKVRRIPAHPRIIAELAGVPSGYVFPGHVGGHLAPSYVGQLLSAHLGAPWTGHTLRHRFATRAYAVDRDLLAVQQLLGHSSPTTTRRYTAIPDDALMTAVMGV